MSLFRNLLIEKKRKPYYCEVEYLASDGSQYIDTEILGNGEFDVDYMYYQTQDQSNAIFAGTRSASQHLNLGQRSNGSGGGFSMAYLGSFWIAASPPAINTKTRVQLSYKNGSQTGFLNGTSLTGNTLTGTEATNLSIYLFKRHHHGTDDVSGLVGRIYYFKLWNNGNLVRDLIPVLDWDYVPCLYDKVTGRLFYNKGTGLFTYGREIHYVDYLESTGTQYINTGIKLNNNHSVELDYQLTQATQSRTGLFGNLTSSMNARYGSLLSPTNHYLEYGYGAGNVYWQQGLTDTNRHKIYQKKNEVYFDGALLYTFNNATFSITDGAPLGNFGYLNYTPAKAKYYSSKWWENDTLVRDYKPAIDENGVSFMFDRVTHTIFDNAGTDAFKYPARETEYTANAETKAYINLGIKYKSSMSIRAKFTRNAQGASGSVISLTTSTINPVVYLPALNATAKTDRYVWRRSTSYAEQRYDFNFNSYPVTEEFEVDAVNDTLTVNGTLALSGMIAGMGGYNSPYQSNSNMFMFSIEENYAGNGKVYYLQIDDNVNGQVVPVFDLIPAYQDGEAGFYNKVDGTFFANASSDSNAVLTAGKIIESEWF